jgi:hypothetical protein
VASVAAISASQTPELRATARETAAVVTATTAAATATITTLLPPVVRERREGTAPAAAPSRRPPSAPPVTRDNPRTNDQTPQQQSGSSSTPSGQFGAFVAQLLGQQSATVTATATPLRLQQATATYQAVTDLTGKQQNSDVQVPGLPASLSSGHVFDLVV